MSIKILIPLICLCLVCSASTESESGIRKKHFNLDNGLAIEGYDPVAYFNSSKAIKGKKEYSVLSGGILYYFSSAVNKDKFLKNPASYEPQYGGWCAYAMAYSGKKVAVDPETFKVTNGKLYLFYNAFFNNTLTDWNKDETKLKGQADKNWKKIID